MENSLKEKTTTGSQEDIPSVNTLFSHQSNLNTENITNEVLEITSIMRFKKYKLGQENRKKLIQAQLKSRRSTNLEKLTTDSKQFLDEFFRKYSDEKNEIILNDLIRFKDILQLVYNQGDMFYYNYFKLKLVDNTVVITNIIDELRKLVLLNLDQIVLKVDTLLTLTEIISDIIQFVEDKESFIENNILKKDIIQLLLTLSQKESQISTNIRINMVLLMASLCEHSQKSAEYFVGGGVLDQLQYYIQQKEIDIDLILNFSWLCYTILKWKTIQKNDQIKIAFCVQYLLWILYEGLEKISFDTTIFAEVSNNICQSLKLVKDIDCYSELVLSEKCIQRILQIVADNFQDENQLFIVMYNQQVKCYYKLLLSLSVKLNKNSDLYIGIINLLETEDCLRKLMIIFHNNLFLETKTLKVCFRIAIYLIEISPVIFDSLFTSSYLHKLINLLEQQHSAMEDVLTLLYFFMLMANEEQLKEFMERTNIIDTALNLLSCETISQEAKLKIVELMQMFLKYGELNQRKDKETDKDINLVQVHFQRKNGKEILNKEMLASKNLDLTEKLHSILDTYFE